MLRLAQRLTSDSRSSRLQLRAIVLRHRHGRHDRFALLTLGSSQHTELKRIVMVSVGEFAWMQCSPTKNRRMHQGCPVTDA